MDDYNLFSVQNYEDEPFRNTTMIIVDGVAKNISIEQLFNPKEYDTVICATYVSSPSFIKKYFSEFENVKIILGIEKDDVRSGFYEGMKKVINNEGQKYFESFDDDMKNKICDNKVIVRYPKPGNVVHSKFYLLKNTSTNNCCLIFGTANLSNRAFNVNVKQYEEVFVSYNRELYSVFEKRFESIYLETEDFIPRNICEQYQRGTYINLVDMTIEEKTDNLIEQLIEHDYTPYINEIGLQKIEQLQTETQIQEEQYKETLEIIAATTKVKSGLLIKKPQYELINMAPKVKDIIFKATKTEQSLERFSLTYKDTEKTTFRLFNANNTLDQQSRPPERFSKKASVDELKKSLSVIGNFILAYQDYVTNPDPQKRNLSRIYEVILYAMLSAYICVMRRESYDNKEDVPVILVIGGRASSGKSNLLAFIDAQLSGRKLPRDEHYFQYKDLSRKGVIKDIFMSENTYPLLVDEVAPNFFNSKGADKGEELIKYLSNKKAEIGPVMLCTTNTSTISLPAQVKRRIHYVQVDSCFDELKKGKANKYYKEVMDEVDNSLFRDVCYRLDEMLANGQSLFDDSTGDFLKVIRNIFEQYYEETGIELPQFFPKKLHNDYEERGRDMWRTLYLNSKETFNSQDNGSSLVVKLKDNVNYNNQSYQSYLHYLRPDILIEDSGVFVKIKCEPFFSWIGLKNPYKQKWYQKLFVKST